MTTTEILAGIFMQSSIKKLQPELQRARIARRRRNAAESRGAQGRSRLPLIRMIQDVEELATELRSKALANAEDLGQGEIHVLIGGADEGVPACISQRKRSRSDESAGVKE